MKPSLYLSLACATVLGTGLLISADPPSQPDPQAAPGDAQPGPPPQPRERGGNPPPSERPPRDNRPGPDDGQRPPRRFDNQTGERPDGNFRPPNNGPGQGERPFRPDGLPPGERPYRPNVPQDGRDDGRGPGRPFATQPAPMKLQAYLGVVTRVAGPDLAAQLKQPEGFGLIVEDVLPEGPAAAAGIHANDLLRMLDDQLLVNPAQLEALVRRAGKEKEVTITILREGTEQKLVAKVGEKMMPVRRPIQPMAYAGDGEPFPPGNQGNRPMRDGPGNRYEDNRNGPPRENGQFDRETRYATDRARVVRRDDSGTYEISRGNGGRIFSALKPDGTLIWKGPVDTEENKKEMPEDVRKKFEEIEKSRPLERLGDRQNQPGGNGPDNPSLRQFAPGEPGGQRQPGPPPARDAARP